MARPLLVPYIVVPLGAAMLLPLILAAMAILVAPFAIVAIAGAATSNSTLLLAGHGLYMLFALFTRFP